MQHNAQHGLQKIQSKYTSFFPDFWFIMKRQKTSANN